MNPPPDEFTAMHGLAVVYLTFASSTGGGMAKEQVPAIASAIEAQGPNMTSDEAGAVCTAAYDWLLAMKDYDDWRAAGEVMVNTLIISGDSPFREHVQAVLFDLIQIAGADGQIHPDEIDFIVNFAKAAGAKVPQDFRAQ